MKRYWLIAMLMLSGCVSVGHEIKTDQIATFRPNETTINQVIAALGPPTATATDSTGQQVLTYAHTQSQVRPATFIPIIGLFAGGADAHSTLAIFHFDPDGKLIKSSTSRAGTNVDMP